MNNFVKFLRPFFIALFVLYIFDLMAIGLNLYIPINIITIFIVGVLGIPGLIMLILFLLFIF